MTGPASILIVDDEAQNRRLLEVLLKPKGYLTRIAASGPEALDSIAADPPDLILLDVMMPGLDGRQVTSALKADPTTRNIPIIMVTAQSDHEARLAALEAGAEDFLTKPVDRAELWLRVRNLLRLKELSDLVERQALDAARSMIESSLDSLVAISPEGMITDANEAMTRVSGVPRESVIGTAFSEYFTDPQKASAIYQLVFEQGMAVDYPLTMRHRDGTLTEVLYNASVYRDGGGSVLGVFAAARDVTKLVQAQREVVELYAREIELRAKDLDRTERLDRQKSDFLATVSHELRTPLTSISGYLELLQDQSAGPLTAQQERMLDAISRNGDRLRSLIEDVMVLSRIEGSIGEADFVEVSIRQLISRVDKRLSALAQRNAITLEIDSAPRAATVLGDPSALDRAVVNIVSNAIKFSGPGKVVTVSGRLDQDAGRVLITCQDHGVGVPAGDLADLFTRFFRASNATDQAIPGSGLGLSIAKQIVEDHHGELRLTSVEGEGTIVVMDLPMLEREPSSTPQRQIPTRRDEGQNAIDDGVHGGGRGTAPFVERGVVR